MSTLLISEIFPPWIGGSGRWFWEIYRRLPRDAYGVVAGVCPGADAFDRTHDLRLRRLSFALPSWGLMHPQALRGYCRLVRQLRRPIREWKVRRIQAGRCLPEGWLAWLLKLSMGIPYTVFVHGEDVEGAATSREYRWMVRRVLASAEFLIANSHNTANILRHSWSIPATKIRVLHPGVETARFVPVPTSAEVRRELGWEGRTVVLTVARLQERKGHDRMIRALHQVRQAVPNVLYAIAGDGEERERLESLVEREGVCEQVRFQGAVDEARLVQCYQQCDLFVLPNRTVGSDIEGFGMVLLEAQACGKPVIAGASGGTAETMRLTETGYTVCCDRPDDLGRLTAELLCDPLRRARMGQAARNWVVERFDWESLAQQADALFRDADASERASPLTDADRPPSLESATSCRTGGGDDA